MALDNAMLKLSFFTEIKKENGERRSFFNHKRFISNFEDEYNLCMNIYYSNF